MLIMFRDRLIFIVQKYTFFVKKNSFYFKGFILKSINFLNSSIWISRFLCEKHYLCEMLNQGNEKSV